MEPVHPAQIADITDADAATLKTASDAVLNSTMVSLNSTAMTLNEFVKQTHAAHGIAPEYRADTDSYRAPAATPRRIDSGAHPSPWKYVSATAPTPADTSLLPAQISLLNANIANLTSAVNKLCGILGAV